MKLDKPQLRPKEKKTEKAGKSVQGYVSLIITGAAFVGLAAASIWYQISIPDELEKYLIGGAVLGAGCWTVITTYLGMRGNR